MRGRLGILALTALVSCSSPRSDPALAADSIMVADSVGIHNIVEQFRNPLSRTAKQVVDNPSSYQRSDGLLVLDTTANTRFDSVLVLGEDYPADCRNCVSQVNVCAFQKGNSQPLFYLIRYSDDPNKYRGHHVARPFSPTDSLSARECTEYLTRFLKTWTR